MRPGRAGKRVGGRQGDRRDERSCGGGAGRHGGAGRGRGAGARRRGDLVRPAQRPLDPARARGHRLSGAADERERRVRHGGRGARVPRERPVQGWRRRGSAGPPRSSRRMLTGAARWSERSRPCAAWCGRATPADRRWTGRARPRHDLRRGHEPPADRLRRPDSIVRDALERARGTVERDPARGDRYYSPGARPPRIVLCCAAAALVAPAGAQEATAGG